MSNPLRGFKPCSLNNHVYVITLYMPSSAE